MKIGRNEPCPCGSGKKYKHCCLSPAAAASDELRELMAAQEINTLEEAQALAQDFMLRRNQQAQDDFQELSPEQVYRMLNFPFDTPALFDFPETLGVEPEVPILTLVRSITDAIDEKGLKATAKGNLPQKLCREAANRYLNELPGHDRQHQLPVNKEEDCVALHATRIILELAGLLRKTKGRFYLTRKYHRLVTQSVLTRLYPVIFKTCCTEFNWGYRDRYDEIPFIQQSFLFTLYLLSRHGDDWKPFSFYEDCFLQAFPMVCDEVGPETYITAEDQIRHCYNLRTLERFLHFMGLVRVERIASDNPFSREFRIMKSPLMDQVVGFNI